MREVERERRQVTDRQTGRVLIDVCKWPGACTFNNVLRFRCNLVFPNNGLETTTTRRGDK